MASDTNRRPLGGAGNEARLGAILDTRRSRTYAISLARWTE
jgi:hypothetical protein